MKWAVHWKALHFQRSARKASARCSFHFSPVSETVSFRRLKIQSPCCIQALTCCIGRWEAMNFGVLQGAEVLIRSVCWLWGLLHPERQNERKRCWEGNVRNFGTLRTFLNIDAFPRKSVILLGNLCDRAGLC